MHSKTVIRMVNRGHNHGREKKGKGEAMGINALVGLDGVAFLRAICIVTTKS